MKRDVFHPEFSENSWISWRIVSSIYALKFLLFVMDRKIGQVDVVAMSSQKYKLNRFFPKRILLSRHHRAEQKD